jgi:hypothetical protein
MHMYDVVIEYFERFSLDSLGFPWVPLDSLAKLEGNSGVAMRKRSRWNLLLFVRFLEKVRYA